MRKFIALCAIGAALTVAGTASAHFWARSDARAVTYQLKHFWRTSDGYRITFAKCSPWWSQGHVVYEYGELFSSAWLCGEVDSLNRVFDLHVWVYRYRIRPVEVRCFSKYSAYRCP